MPYVNQSERITSYTYKDKYGYTTTAPLDKLIDDIIFHLQQEEPGTRNGRVNYIISRIVAGGLKPDNGWNYDSLSDGVKAFECAKLEFVRRLVNPYEDEAIDRNGDIPEYKDGP